MCGIAGIVGNGWTEMQLAAMVAQQRHRGPDAQGTYIDQTRRAGLGHNRLSILDLSACGTQPMSTPDRRLWIAFNGEIYNYVELKQQLADYPYRTNTDTEVLLAAYERWGMECLDHLIGMFAFLLWDEREQRLFAARDRFGVKPLVYAKMTDGSLFLSSEIKALHAAGIPAVVDDATWATYLTYGLSDHTSHTFWRNVRALPAGHALTWRDGAIHTWCWYDLAARVGPDFDERDLDVVQEEYLALLKESVRLRFRADVPVGINLSGGLDSSTLLGLVQAVQRNDIEVRAFTFATGHDAYDELPWVAKMLEHTRHPSTICPLRPADVPALAAAVQHHEEEPFGGVPTLAYARVFEQAAALGVTVLLDGQGMDEQWAGYDYYHAAEGGAALSIQGTKESPVRPACLQPDFARLAEPLEACAPFADRLRNQQYRDIRYAKIPRALRFNDRVSMRSSTELREPFLDHRAVELALRQPPQRKVDGHTRKWLLRRAVASLLPAGVLEAPKRPVQTPQREWLAGELRGWATDLIETALRADGGNWLQPDAVRTEWARFCAGQSDNSYYVWQWLSLGLTIDTRPSSLARQVPAEVASQ